VVSGDALQSGKQMTLQMAKTFNKLNKKETKGK